jgi:hypothetical protein
MLPDVPVVANISAKPVSVRASASEPPPIENSTIARKPKVKVTPSSAEDSISTISETSIMDTACNEKSKKTDAIKAIRK